MGIFATVDGMMLGEQQGIGFGPDNDLYVASTNTGTIQRFDGKTGASKGVFASGLLFPTVFAWAPDGDLYVAEDYSYPVKRFDGSTGAFVQNVVTDGLAYTYGLTFTPFPHFHVCLLYDPNRATRSGATDPIKLQLCDATGNDLSTPTLSLHATSITFVSTWISGSVDAPGNANPDNDFRFDASLGSTGGYIFNLSTRGLATGSYNLNFTVTGDGFSYAAPFQVK